MDEQPVMDTPNAPAARFVGRTTLINRLNQHIIDPAEAIAQCVMGRQQIGKSALLRHLHSVLGVDMITVYVPLRETVYRDEVDLLRQLVTASIAAVLHSGEYNLERVDTLPDSDISAWMVNEFIPTIFRIIRPHRRLVWLLDDVEMLVDAIQQERLNSDFVEYIHLVLANHTQFSIVATIDSTRETDLTALRPLVNPNIVHRLTHLSLEESTSLLRHYVSRITDEAGQTVYRQTGGHPALTQRFAIQLSKSSSVEIEPTQIQPMVKAIYESSLSIFHSLWRMLVLNERLVLTALSNLLYENQDRALGIDAIETWLVETDYPMDTTAITAAVRSLEYHEIVVGTSTNLNIAAGMMQMWLLEYGNLEDAPRKESLSQPTTTLSTRMWVAIIAIVIGLLLVVAILSSLNNPSTPSGDTPQPTVTLSSGT